MKLPSLDLLANQVKENGHVDSDLLTSEEWAEYWGCSKYLARETIKRAAAMGLVTSKRKLKTNMAGVEFPTPAYSIKMPRKGRSRRKK